MKKIHLIFICCFAIRAYSSAGQSWMHVPTQALPLYQLNDNTHQSSALFNVDSLNISSQVTFGAYKQYLTAVKRDSGYFFYLTQLPDSTITSPDRYIDYLQNPIYNYSPVAGISWEAAINFCKWKLLKDNPDDSILFIYNLPKVSQWLAAKHFLDSSNIDNDFSKNFSDWTVGMYFEGGFGIKEFYYDFVQYVTVNTALRDKRKIVAGNNYLFMTDYVVHKKGYFQNSGYRYVSFRLIKEKYDDKKLEHPRPLQYRQSLQKKLGKYKISKKRGLFSFV
jgi:hypothetical protein